MKKISQAIIGATLILDVAVVFTFGLAVISSFEDGSRLPETTFVRQSIEGRVAGTMTTNNFPDSTLQIYLIYPATDGEIFSGLKILKAKTSGEVYSVKFTVTRNSNNATGDMAATRVTGTTLDWNREINTLLMPNEPHSISAKALSMSGEVLAASPIITINVLNDNTATSTDNALTPSAAITRPLIDGAVISEPSFVVGGDFNAPAGVLAKNGGLHILKTDGTNAVTNSILAANIPTGSNRWESVLLTDQIDSGDYDLIFKVVYADSSGTDKVAASSPRRVKISRTSTSTNTSNNQNINYNSNTSSTNTSTTNANTSTSTSGTNTNSTTSTNTSTGTSGSTGATTPPPTGTTAATMTVAMTNPVPSTTPVILRSRDNSLVAKTSVSVPGLKFIIHKSGEPVTQYIPINADYSDGINWKANMNLMIFNDGEYDITAVVGDIKSASLNVVVQKFAFNWLTPLPSQTLPVLSGNVPIKAKIGGIYEKDGTTPVKGVKAYFYQAKTTAPYTEIYNEQLYQIPGSQEWRLYDWTLKREKLWKTDASPNGKFHLIIKVINESISATEIWSPAEKILIEINNQQTVASSINTNASAVGTNNNQNLNTAATNTTATNAAASNSSNITVVGNANSANNSNSDSAQNANTANDSAAAAAQIDSDQDLLSDEDERARGTDPNLADTDNDGLTDFVEIDKYKTDPLKNDTDGDGYLDGEEVQSFHDPLKSPTDPTAAILLKPKPVEEPKNVEKPILESLVVERIENKPLPLPDNTNNPEPPPDENIIILKGRGPANTILTLFIYSVDPLVITVKTDDDGNWEYELDKKLEDGEHELYVTITDDTGKIQSQSNPIAFFVKEAKAVSPENYRADLVAREPVKTNSTDIYLIASGVLVLIAAIAGLAVALRRKSGI